MKKFHTRLTAICALAGVFLLLPALAQPPAISANRILFVVDTSRAMRQLLPAASDCVRELVASGLGGQLHAGDTIGLWTYDSELHAGIFPMQVWTDDHGLDIAQAMGDYLRQQKTSGKARLASAWPGMLQVIGASEAITVLLISDGQEAIHGTPFDDSINEVFQQHGRELKDAHQPFVTVLVARAGKILKCNINSATGVSVPALPLPGETNPAPAIVESRPVAPPPEPLPVRTNPPLILDYSKSNLNTAINPATVRPPEKILILRTNSKTSVSNPTVVLIQPPPAPASEEVETSAPPSLSTNLPVASAPKSSGAWPLSSETSTEISTVLPPLPPSNVPASLPVTGTLPQKMTVAAAQSSFSALGVFIAVAALLLVGGLWLVLARRRTASRTGAAA